MWQLSAVTRTESTNINIMSWKYLDWIIYNKPVPGAERSQARVYGRSLAGIAASNPAGGMDGCLL